ncbi:SnoaL-like polyketide cyclase-domain-containing protein [Daldinia bambusicola]|nr:SnoaL-like polyketide cyclase-domain-containing protein [Daldinia bambusicola]
MSATPSELVATIRGWIQSVNEKKWDDLPKYLHSTYSQNGTEYTPESWATHIREHVTPLMGGDIIINEDNILVDEDSQCASFSLWIKFKPEVPLLGYLPKGHDIYLVERGFAWFTDGKLSKTLLAVNSDEIRKQLAEPDADFAPSLICEEPVPTMETLLPREKLADILIAYVDSFNARRTKTDYVKYVHRPEEVMNNKTLARRIMDDTVTAIPDLQVQIHTLIADEESQRVAVWLKFNGTPVKEYAGLVVDGRPVQFTEHATYQIVDGKIQRIWGFMDWDEARQQQKPAGRKSLPML